jgi:hypothetical protein
MIPRADLRPLARLMQEPVSIRRLAASPEQQIAADQDMLLQLA